MIRRINYTDRQKIARENVAIQLHAPEGRAPWFSADLQLESLDLPTDATVCVEAYYQQDYQRFGFGRVGRIAPDSATEIVDVPWTGSMLFRVKVVSPGEGGGLILAVADRLTPVVVEGPSHRQSILPVEFRDLGEELWCVEFDVDRPILVVNNAGRLATRMREVVTSDPAFIALVYPGVVRQVLRHFLLVEHERDDDDDDERPASHWFRFARRFSPGPPPVVDPDDEASQAHAAEWVDSVASRFARWINARGRFSSHIGLDS